MATRKLRFGSSDVQSGLSRVLIDKANECVNPLDEIEGHWNTLSTSKGQFVTHCARSLTLPDDQIDQCLRLTELNMRDMYEQSEWGWDESSKRKELTHSKAFLIQVRSAADPSDLVAFAHFRFELDEDKTRSVCYCYELQVALDHQRSGLGRQLMKALEQIGRRFKMKKLLLTCFVYNKPALTFYTETLGFHVDRFSPSKFPNQATFYEILSKRIV
jgi:GNAT superfamily N-acetyltransferase